MKLAYDQLCDEISRLFAKTDVSKWQNTLEQLLQSKGWSREEFNQKVIKEYNKYQTPKV